MITPTSEARFNDAADQLMQRYLSLSADAREQEFPGTARAAQLVGVPRRTIQFWIEIGKVEAISVGRNYKVHLKSLLSCLHSHVTQY